MGRRWRPIFWYRLVGLLVMLQACVQGDDRQTITGVEGPREES
jgi:hypothetical protein